MNDPNIGPYPDGAGPAHQPDENPGVIPPADNPPIAGPQAVNPLADPRAVMLPTVLQLLDPYDGTGKIRDYIENVESISKLFGIDGENLKTLVMLKLIGRAKEYLDSQMEIKLRGTWVQLRAGLLERFKVEVFPGQAEQEFYSCKQRQGEMVKEYVERVRRCGLRTIKYGEDQQRNAIITQLLDDSVLRVFLAGLQSPIKQRILSREPRNMDEATKIAILEEQIERMTARAGQMSVRAVTETHGQATEPRREFLPPRGAGRQPQGNQMLCRPRNPTNTASSYRYMQPQTYGPSLASGTQRHVSFQETQLQRRNAPSMPQSVRRNYTDGHGPQIPTGRTEQRVPRCFTCGKMGHISWDCANRPPISCYSCGLQGHIARNCPVKSHHIVNQRLNTVPQTLNASRGASIAVRETSPHPRAD